MMTTVEKILALAESKGISRLALADMLSIREHTFDDWESGLKEPTIMDIVKISEYFNVTTDYLLKEDVYSHVRENS